MKSIPVPMPPEEIPTEAQLMSTWKGDQDKPLVTVLCTTYNHEPFIRNALHGFLIQRTTFPFRVVVHDDASTDQTAEIVREYERRFPRIIRGIYQPTNLYSRKIDLSSYVDPLIEGEFVALCEGDDYWTDFRKLEDQARYLLTNPDCSLVCQPHINAKLEFGGLVAKGGGRETFLTLTRMYRHDIGLEYPAELHNLPNGDRGTLVHLWTRGRIVHLSHLKPAVRVIHPGGVMSMKPKREQLHRQFETWDRIYHYYKNTQYSHPARLSVLRARRNLRYLDYTEEYRVSKKFVNGLLYFGARFRVDWSKFAGRIMGNEIDFNEVLVGNRSSRNDAGIG